MAFARRPRSQTQLGSDSQPSCIETCSLCTRQSLIDGPPIMVIISHSGNALEYLHQISSAGGVAYTNRIQQMREQGDSNHRRYLVEFPRKAMTASSPQAQRYFEQNSNETEMCIDMGHILPGYAMEVLDWYAQALTANTWFDFPTQSIFEGTCKWYYYYIYVTMQLFGMTTFAAKLQDHLYFHIDDLANDYGGYIHILRHLSDNDPLLEKLARRTAKLIAQDKLPMKEGYVHKINRRFPAFERLVTHHLRSSREDVVRKDKTARENQRILDRNILGSDEIDVGDMRNQLSQSAEDEASEVDKLRNPIGHIHIAS